MCVVRVFRWHSSSLTASLPTTLLTPTQFQNKKGVKHIFWEASFLDVADRAPRKP